MNNKGFSTVELVVSFTLTTVIVLFLIEIIFLIKDLYVSIGVKMKLLTKQTTINKIINDDFVSKKVTLATTCGDNCFKFFFDDETSKILSYDKDKKTISYGNYTTSLLSGSKFGNIVVSTSIDVNVKDSNNLNGILNIQIPVYHSLIEKEDFGVNLLYLFNSNLTSLSGLNHQDIVDAEKKIYLINDTDIAFKGINYSDTGYYVLNTLTEDVVYNDPAVQVVGSVDTSKVGNYYLTYTIYNMNGSVMDQVVKTVNVIDSVNTFEYKGDTETFVTPINGKYKIELWGASGGGTTIMSGKGGYTVSEYNLEAGDVLYINVGGKGTTGTNGVAAKGGFNGGGDSGVSTKNFASSGGGASDVRLNSNELTSRILVAGGGAGGGSRNDSTIACYGGVGGGETGGIGKCTADSYLGGAGTSTSGGLAATYKTNLTVNPTAGTLGIGGNGASYVNGTENYAAGGGGGGYYGGGGGSRYGGGGGGSGLCGGVTCKTYKGTETFISPDDKTSENGHSGNGVVKITLISIN